MAFVPRSTANKENKGRQEKKDDLVEVYAAHLSGLSRQSRFPLARYKTLTAENPLFDRPVDHLYVPYFEAARDYAAIDRAFYLCGDGRVERVSDSAEVGDRIIISLGGTVPILLRPSASDYIVLGEAYVDGMIDGEAFRGPEVQMEPITLV